MKKGELGVVLPFLMSWVPVPFAELPTALHWDRASRGSQTTWSAGATLRRVYGRICHFQWKTSGDYDNSVFWIWICSTFFLIVRHQLLKK